MSNKNNKTKELKDRKFVKSLEELKKEELEEFKKNVLLNKPKKLLALASYIIDSAPKFENISDEEAMTKIESNEQTLKNTLSKLQGLLKNFMDSYNKERVFQENQSLNEYFQIENKEENGGELLKMNNFLDLFWVEKRLSIICQMIYSNRLLSKKYDWSTLLNETTIFIQKNNLLKDEHPKLSIYFYLVKILSGNIGGEYMDKVDKLMEDNIKNFEFETRHEIYKYILNYYTKKINDGEGVEDYFKRLKEGVDKRLIIDGENEIKPRLFQTIVAVGVRVGEYEWTHDFLKKNDYLLKNENFKQFIRGYFFAENKLEKEEDRYKKAFEIFPELKTAHEDHIIYFGMNAIYLKYYFIKDEEISFNSRVKAFKTWIRSEKKHRLIPEIHQSRATLFVEFINELFRIKGMDMSKGEWLIKLNDYDKRLKSESLANKNWLLEKVKEMKSTL